VEDYIRRDSLLLNIREWRGWAGDRNIWRRTIEEARTDVGCRAIEEEKKKSKYRNCVSTNQRNLNPCKSRTYCTDVEQHTLGL
jgi:hypothetical protein